MYIREMNLSGLISKQLIVTRSLTIKKLELMSYSFKCRNLHRPTEHDSSFSSYLTEDGTSNRLVCNVLDLGGKRECSEAFEKQVRVSTQLPDS